MMMASPSSSSNNNHTSLLFWTGSIVLNSALWGYYFHTVCSPREALQHVTSLILGQAKANRIGSVLQAAADDKGNKLTDDNNIEEDDIPRVIYIHRNWNDSDTEQEEEEE